MVLFSPHWWRAGKVWPRGGGGGVGSTNWGYCKEVKSNQLKLKIGLLFEERGNPEYPDKNVSEQSREPTNPHMAPNL